MAAFFIAVGTFSSVHASPLITGGPGTAKAVLVKLSDDFEGAQLNPMWAILGEGEGSVSQSFGALIMDSGATTWVGEPQYVDRSMRVLYNRVLFPHQSFRIETDVAVHTTSTGLFNIGLALFPANLAAEAEIQLTLGQRQDLLWVGETATLVTSPTIASQAAQDYDSVLANWPRDQYVRLVMEYNATVGLVRLSVPEFGYDRFVIFSGLNEGFYVGLFAGFTGTGYYYGDPDIGDELGRVVGSFNFIDSDLETIAYEVSYAPLSLDGVLFDQNLGISFSQAQEIAYWFDPSRPSLFPEILPGGALLNLDGVRDVHAYLIDFGEGSRGTLYSPLTPAQFASYVPPEVTAAAFVPQIFRAQGFGADYVWNLAEELAGGPLHDCREDPNVPDADACQAFQDFAATHPGWEAMWYPSGYAWFVAGPPITITTEAVITPVAPVVPPGFEPAVVDDPMISSEPSLKHTILSASTLADKYLSGALEEEFHFHGLVYFKRVLGLEAAENQPAYEFHVRERLWFTDPSGRTALYIDRMVPADLTCADATVDPVPASPDCGYTRQAYDLRMPITLETEEGRWGFTARLELVQTFSNGRSVVQDNMEFAGGFLVDSTPPVLALVKPLPNSVLHAPVGVTSMTFHFADLSTAEASGIASFEASVGEVEGLVWSQSKDAADVIFDLTGKTGAIVVMSVVKDMAGNETAIVDTLQIRNETERLWLTKAAGFLAEMQPLIGADVEAGDLQVMTLLSPNPSENAESVFNMDTGEFESQYMDENIVTIRYAQMGPGNYPIEDAFLSVALTLEGEGIGIESGFVENLIDVPSINVSAVEAIAIAKGKLPSQIEPTLISHDLAWVFSPIAGHLQRYILGWRVVVYSEASAPISFLINSETGAVERANVIASAITGNFSSANQNGDIVILRNRADTGYRLLVPLVGPLETDWVSPGVALNGIPGSWDDSYLFEPGGFLKYFEQLSMLRLNKDYNYLTKNVLGYAQNFPRTGRKQAAAFFNACKVLGSTACAVPILSPGNTLSSLAAVEYWYDDGISNPWLTIHETTHGILYGRGLFPGGRTWDLISLVGYADGTSPYGWFHEGFAQAQECIYFDYCRKTFGSRTAEALNEHNDSDPHVRGRPFEFALRDINERIKMYGDVPLSRRGFRLSWGMADFIALRPYVQDDELKNVQQLGRTANTMAARVRAGTGGIVERENQEAFVSEIAYWYQYHGMPLGAQASISPPKANMIGFRVGNNFDFDSPSVWGSTIKRGSAPQIRTIGSRTKEVSATDTRDLYHETRLYFSNPLLAGLNSHCASVRSTATTSTGIVRPGVFTLSGDWLGDVTYGRERVNTAITECITPIVGTLRECLLDFHVDVLLWERGLDPETGKIKNDNKLLARASTIGLFHNSSVYPSFRIDNNVDEEECGKRAAAALLAGIFEKTFAKRGCAIAKATGTDLFLFASPFIWLFVRARGRGRLKAGGIEKA